MINIKFFGYLFESITDYRKIVLLLFAIKDDSNLLKEVGFSKNDNNHLSSDLNIILLEKNGEYLEFLKNEEESVIENIPSE